MQGLMWYYKNENGRTLFGHNGGDVGSSTDMFVSFLENIAVALRKNSQMVRMIQASTFMSANEKAQMIDQIYMMMIATAKMANNIVLTTRKFKKEYKKKKK